jgi:xylulokinase
MCPDAWPKSCHIWPDLRAVSQAEAINRSGRFSGISAHYTAAKLLWAKENRPSILAEAYKFLVPTDFLRTSLTGDFFTDPTSAGGTQMYDQDKRDWNWGLADYIGLDHSLFPQIHPTGAMAGKVTAEAAAETGLSPGTPVITGGGDYSVTVPFLQRLKAENSLLLYLGTAPIASLMTREGKWMGAGIMSASGGAGLKWFKEQFCPMEEYVSSRTGRSPYVMMDQESSMIDPGSDGVVFIPHLMGERGPYNDYARGVVFGLSLGHRREHVMRALLEGITFQLRSYWEQAQSKEAIDVDKIVVFGGGAKSHFWRQLIADVFGCPTYTLASDEISSLHLAALTATALGHYKDLDAAYDRIDLSFTGRLEPTTLHKEKIEKAYRLFKKVDENLQSVYNVENLPG